MSDLERALEALESGGVLALPTDTVFGLACRLDRPGAVEKLFEVKGRSRSAPFQVLLADAERIGDVAELGPVAARLAGDFLPGGLMLVLNASGALPDLGGAAGTVGVRVPKHPVAAAVLARSGPLAASSANRSGEPTPDSMDGVRAVFGARVDAYIDGPPAPAGTASSIVDLTGDRPRLLREGVIGRAELEKSAGLPIL